MPFILGVDIGGTDIKLGIVDDSAAAAPFSREIVSGTIPTRAGEGPELAAARVRAWCEERDAAPAAAGIACAGLIDGARGILHVSPNLAGWIDVPLRALFERELGVPAAVENDANAAAYGEWRAGAGRGLRSFVCLTLGTGVGGGIVLDGSLYRGATGFAGEIGHTVILADGPPCACGSRGCLEALIGAPAITRRARELYGAREGTPAGSGSIGSVADLARAAAAGDEIASRVFEETGRFLGVALANVVHILAPEAIVVGGGVAGAGEILFGPARETLRRCVMDASMAEVRIVPAELGNRAAVLGSALLARAEAGGAR